MPPRAARPAPHQLLTQISTLLAQISAFVTLIFGCIVTSYERISCAVVLILCVMVASLGVATSAFALVLIVPVLVVAGFMYVFHPRFTFAEGFAFLFAVITGVSDNGEWFIRLPLGNAFLVQCTSFYKPSVPVYDPAFVPVNASELVFAMDINTTGERFVALVGAKGIGKWNSFVPKFHEPFMFRGKMKTTRRFTKCCQHSCGETYACFYYSQISFGVVQFSVLTGGTSHETLTSAIFVRMSRAMSPTKRMCTF